MKLGEVRTMLKRLEDNVTRKAALLTRSRFEALNVDEQNELNILNTQIKELEEIEV